jgi:hypothetical protein
LPLSATSIAAISSARYLDRGDLLRPLGDQVGEPHHQPAPAGGGERAPGFALERSAGRANGPIDVLGAAEREGRPGAAGGRVQRLERRAARGVDVPAADQEAVLLHDRLLRVG